MSTFKVKITRTEVYERVVEVEAKSEKDARRIAQDRELDNEYANMFDCPDNVFTKFSVVGEDKEVQHD